ncbi:MAG: DUF2798 domain-containing protein [Lachnospiraceae bacterium]|jgi:hypothetical protein|nr:DUF2798 domain-containing protein [uncultured Schaedlerella sp.]MCI9080625.1 DUF2798 domain-containing protein [Lachnospiraceae bacterium]
MFAKKYYGVLMNFWLSLFNGIVVSATMMYVNTGIILPVALIVSSLEAFIVSFITGLLIPAAPLGAKLAEDKLKALPGSIKYNLISNIPVCITMAVILSLVFALINVGFQSSMFMAWIGSIPIAFIASYITSVVLTPVVVKLSNALTK